MNFPVLRHSSSFRDPSGYLFYYNESLYRQVSQAYQKDFALFNSSGLYSSLVQKNWLLPHLVIDQNFTGDKDWYTTLKPEPLPFVSYPYEWSFDMLKEAALRTLDIAEEAAQKGMMLKDASAYNLQWHKGQMIFIDTLSFEDWNATEPWVAYRQFCEHFLAPLALMHFHKLPLQQLSLAYQEGVPVAVAAKLLPWKSRFHLHTYLHLHLHGNMVIKTGADPKKKVSFSAVKMKNLLQSLRTAVQSYHLQTKTGVWSGYYDEALQRNDYVAQKKDTISKWVDTLTIKTAIDVGANEGSFSLLLAKKGLEVVSADFDHYSVNALYHLVKKERVTNVLPLVMNFSAPSPAIGANNLERASFLERTSRDLVLALAVLHHLVFTNYFSFEMAAQLFVHLGRYLMIEFIPATDAKVQQMLQQKTLEFDWYNEETFVKTFSCHYTILERKQIKDSERILYLMKPHEN